MGGVVSSVSNAVSSVGQAVTAPIATAASHVPVVGGVLQNTVKAGGAAFTGNLPNAIGDTKGAIDSARGVVTSTTGLTTNQAIDIGAAVATGGVVPDVGALTDALNASNGIHNETKPIGVNPRPANLGPYVPGTFGAPAAAASSDLTTQILIVGGLALGVYLILKFRKGRS